MIEGTVNIFYNGENGRRAGDMRLLGKFTLVNDRVEIIKW